MAPDRNDEHPEELEASSSERAVRADPAPEEFSVPSSKGTTAIDPSAGKDESGRRREDLLAVCATDLRAPLNVLLEETRHLLGGSHGALSDAQRESLRTVERQGERLLRVSQEILDLSTPDAGWPNTSRAAPAGQGRSSSAETSPLILVAEDDPDLRQALSELLEDDFAVIAVCDGKEALERAHSSPPDLILMDLGMPRMDGFAAIEALRSSPRTAEIPVIFLSARGDDVTKVKSLDLGAVDFIQKPFSERELKARIGRTLRFTQRQSQLRRLAGTDHLTGLPNLRSFRTRMEEETRRSRRYLTPLTCVMADLDELKPINDQFGHTVGDQALAAVAELIRRELRETDFGARYGGDEFVVLLPHTTAAEGEVFAERVCARLREAWIDVGERRIQLAVSFGVAQLPADALDEDGTVLVSLADRALYAAKRAGRGQVAVHEGAGV